MRGSWRAITCGAILGILAAPVVPCGRAGADEEAGRSAGVTADRFDLDVRIGGRPLEEYAWGGRRYIEAIEGAEFEVRITNPSADRVAVVLTVDGLNTIDARRDPAWEASKWVIGPYRSYTISGWQMSTSRARRFYFTTEGDSYAARLGLSSDPGVIKATIFRERRPIAVITPRRGGAGLERLETRSAAEAGAPAARADATRRLPGGGSYRERDEDRAATGSGRSVYHEVRSVEMELERYPVAELTILYKYRPELRRLGILPHYAPAPDEPRIPDRPIRREDSRFCPEPD